MTIDQSSTWYPVLTPVEQTFRRTGPFGPRNFESRDTSKYHHIRTARAGPCRQDLCVATPGPRGEWVGISLRPADALHKIPHRA